MTEFAKKMKVLLKTFRMENLGSNCPTRPNGDPLQKSLQEEPIYNFTYMKKSVQELTISILEAPESVNHINADGLQKRTRKGVMRGNKEQISITFPPEMITKIDAAAEELGISRAAWISMTLSLALKSKDR